LGKPLEWRRVLRHSPTKVVQGTVRRHYEQYRRENGIPYRCDIPDCRFHHGDLTWNGKPLRMILDHIRGDSRDNRPAQLRFLCPNCDSQELETRGGANKGRVRPSSGGRSIRSRGGNWQTELITDPGKFRVFASPTKRGKARRRRGPSSS
jgi:hypothetical protein